MGVPQLDNIPLEWIRAFEAAGRTGSFTSAATETGLTQSAISQRISHLERRVGSPLFLRQARGVMLTVDGEAWLPYVSAAMDGLRQSTESMFGVQQKHLTISASNSVIELWITPRLQAMPMEVGTQFSLKTMVLSNDVPLQDDIVRVRYGTGEWGQTYKAPLFRERISPVVSPVLLETASSWQDLPRIAVSGPRAGWSQWIDQTQASQSPIPTLRFDTFSSALAAARAGLGVMLGSLPLCMEDLNSGRLKRVSDYELTQDETYWLLASDKYLSRSRWSKMLETMT